MNCTLARREEAQFGTSEMAGEGNQHQPYEACHDFVIQSVHIRHLGSRKPQDRPSKLHPMNQDQCGFLLIRRDMRRVVLLMLRLRVGNSRGSQYASASWSDCVTREANCAFGPKPIVASVPQRTKTGFCFPDRVAIHGFARYSKPPMNLETLVS